MNKDILQIIYNYCDIFTLENLSSTCKKYYLYANDRYYNQRIELFYKLTKTDICAIVPIILSYFQNYSRFYRKHPRYYIIPQLFKLENYLHNLEKKSQVIYDFINGVFWCHNPLSSAEIDNIGTDINKKLIKKLTYGIRYNYFRKILHKNNIKRLPKDHYVGFIHTRCKLQRIVEKSGKIIFSSDNSNLCLYDFIITDSELYIALPDKASFKLEPLIRPKYMSSSFYDCIEMYQICNTKELSLLYGTEYDEFYISGFKFVKGEIIDGIYKAYFIFPENNTPKELTKIALTI